MKWRANQPKMSSPPFGVYGQYSLYINLNHPICKSLCLHVSVCVCVFYVYIFHILLHIPNHSRSLSHQPAEHDYITRNGHKHNYPQGRWAGGRTQSLSTTGNPCYTIIYIYSRFRFRQSFKCIWANKRRLVDEYKLCVAGNGGCFCWLSRWCWRRRWWRPWRPLYVDFVRKKGCRGWTICVLFMLQYTLHIYIV